MGKDSAIEWTKHTFNPWIGCHKVSAGCKNCYAETLMATRWGQVEWGIQGQRKRTSAANWKQPLKWNRAAAAAGRKDPVFCASLADIFEQKEDQPEMNAWRTDLFTLIEATPNLFWLLLTKRPENIFGMAPVGWLAGCPRNIGFGVSAEDQATLDERWPDLDSATHHMRPELLFLSYEPALGPIDLADHLVKIDIGDEEHSWWTRPPDWVIAGGESGPKARPAHPDWFRAVRDQIVENDEMYGIPFLFKQWGRWLPRTQMKGVTIKDLSIIEYYKDAGKKAAGRLLDGREWSQFPDVFTPPTRR